MRPVDLALEAEKAKEKVVHVAQLLETLETWHRDGEDSEELVAALAAGARSLAMEVVGDLAVATDQHEIETTKGLREVRS